MTITAERIGTSYVYHCWCCNEIYRESGILEHMGGYASQNDMTMAIRALKNAQAAATVRKHTTRSSAMKKAEKNGYPLEKESNGDHYMSLYFWLDNVKPGWESMTPKELDLWLKNQHESSMFKKLVSTTRSSSVVGIDVHVGQHFIYYIVF